MPPKTREKKKAKPNRGWHQDRLITIANALLDTALVNSVYIVMQQSRSKADYLGYIEIHAGTLDEVAFDALRDVVHRAGGKLLVLSPDDASTGRRNIRVWVNTD